jgi:hypothetical protein
MDKDTVKYGGYTFHVYSKETTWNDVPGVYMFSSINERGRWVPCYIGQCDSFADRIPDHERWEDAQTFGATHVLATKVDRQAARDALEQQAIADLQPPLNTHYR